MQIDVDHCLVDVLSNAGKERPFIGSGKQNSGHLPYDMILRDKSPRTGIYTVIAKIAHNKIMSFRNHDSGRFLGNWSVRHGIDSV